MLNIEELLLLNAAYLRKANHPTETDAEISKGVIEDLIKISAQMKAAPWQQLRPEDYPDQQP